MDKLTNKIVKYIREENLLPKGAAVTVGFSGGADSVCLLSVLWSVRRLLGITVQAVHVNHNLRGEEALRDEAFCRAFCEERGIPFRAVSVDVSGLSSEEGLSVEEAARILRYRALFEEARREVSADTPPELVKIAAAHHADDQAETILLNLLRGTGLRGLRGMEAEREGIVRPLLSVRKEEILAYCEENGLSFVTDSTNNSNDYTRNRIRNEILPALREVNEGASLHILAAGQMAGEADEYLSVKAGEWIRAHAEICTVGTIQSEVRIPVKILKEELPIFRRYVIIEVLRNMGVPLKDWGESHIASIDGALFQGNGHHVDLPRGVTADRSGQRLVLQAGKERKSV